MKNIIFAVVVLCAVSILAACKKEDSTGGGGGGGKKPFSGIRVKTISTDTGVVENFIYDTEGRQIRSESANLTITYHYRVNALDRTILYHYNNTVWTVRYYLNKNGLADSMVDVTVGRQRQLVDMYYYDGNGYLIRRIYPYQPPVPEAEYTFGIENGNIIWQKGPYLNTDISYSYNDKLNTIGSENLGVSFLGKQSVNLMSAEDYTFAQSTYPYTYTYDSLGRVATRTNNSVNSPSGKFTYYYTYY